MTVRRTRPADLAACLEIVHGRYAFGEADEQAALAFWTHLLESRAGFSRVVTTVASPREERILVFALGVFATDDFIREALTTLPPHLGLQAVRRWRSGKRVHLSQREIARDNAGDGLNLVTIAYGTNCWTRVPFSTGMLREGLEAFRRIVRDGHPTTPIVVVSPILRPDAEAQANVLGATLADLRAAMEELAGSWADGRVVPGLPLVANSQLADGVHPNDEGHRAMADAIEPAIRAAIRPS